MLSSKTLFHSLGPRAAIISTCDLYNLSQNLRSLCNLQIHKPTVRHSMRGPRFKIQNMLLIMALCPRSSFTTSAGGIQSTRKSLYVLLLSAASLFPFKSCISTGMSSSTAVHSDTFSGVRAMICTHSNLFLPIFCSPTLMPFKSRSIVGYGVRSLPIQRLKTTACYSLLRTKPRLLVAMLAKCQHFAAIIRCRTRDDECLFPRSLPLWSDSRCCAIPHISNQQH